MRFSAALLASCFAFNAVIAAAETPALKPDITVTADGTADFKTVQGQREALDSSSSGFRPSAMPSQLPTRHRSVVVAAPHITSQIKKPGVLVTPGF